MTRECSLTIDVVVGGAGLRRAGALRRSVFIEEQNVPDELEWDGDDACADHYIASRDGQVVAVARLLPSPDRRRAKVQRVAVRHDLRGRGIGSDLMRRMIADAEQAGVKELVLDAQTHAISFYERLGFEVTSSPFLDAGIPHVHMTRQTKGS